MAVKTKTIKLDDFFSVDGKILEPGEHVVTETNYDFLSTQIELIGKKKEEEIERQRIEDERLMLAANNGKGVNVNTAGMSADDIQAMIDQAVAVRTTELQNQITELQESLEEEETEKADSKAASDSGTPSKPS